MALKHRARDIVAIDAVMSSRVMSRGPVKGGWAHSFPAFLLTTLDPPPPTHTQPQSRCLLRGNVGHLYMSASQVALRLGNAEGCEEQLKSGLSLWGDWLFIYKRACGALLRSKAYNNLGITNLTLERWAEAERYLREAIDKYEALPRLYQREELPEKEWEEAERLLGSALTSLATVLEEQGKAADAQELVDDKVVPLLVRQVLGSAATEAEVRAFNLEAATTVPLPSVNCMAALGDWLMQQPATTSAADRSCVMVVKQRILKRREEQEGAGHCHTIAELRDLLRSFILELPLDEVNALYIRDRAAPRSLAAGYDPSKLTFLVGVRFLAEARFDGFEIGDQGKAERAAVLISEAVEMASELDGGQPSQRLARYFGYLGVARLARGERQAAEATFKRALATAQAVWGEELLGAGMDTSNWEWVEVYLWMLKGNLRESLGPDDTVDEALAVRYLWLDALSAELQGKEHDLADETLEELRAAMRRARGAGTAAPLSRRQQQRMEAQRRKAEARRLKKQRELALALAAREAANEAKAAGDGEGQGDDKEETELAAATAADEAEAEAAAEEEEVECSICLLELGEAGEGSKTLGCGHVYHAGCIVEWVDTCRRKDLTVACPYCREKISV